MFVFNSSGPIKRVATLHVHLPEGVYHSTADPSRRITIDDSSQPSNQDRSVTRDNEIPGYILVPSHNEIVKVNFDIMGSRTVILSDNDYIQWRMRALAYVALEEAMARAEKAGAEHR